MKSDATSELNWILGYPSEVRELPDVVWEVPSTHTLELGLGTQKI